MFILDANDESKLQGHGSYKPKPGITYPNLQTSIKSNIMQSGKKLEMSTADMEICLYTFFVRCIHDVLFHNKSFLKHWSTAWKHSLESQ